MLYINQLFHLEDVIRSKYSSFDAIKKARLEKEKPVVEGFLSWLDQQNPIRGSRMDKAVTYIQNRRSYLSTYLEDGRCSFSNNLSENAIRPLAFAISTIVYTIALAWAPFGVSQNSQFLRPTVNGRIAFSLRLLEKLQRPSSR